LGREGGGTFLVSYSMEVEHTKASTPSPERNKEALRLFIFQIPLFSSPLLFPKEGAGG
jgi:hypothetical protein